MLAGTTSFKPKTCQLKYLCLSSQAMLDPPKSREVHVWCLFPNEVHQSSLLHLYESILPNEERTRVFQAKSKKVQKEHLLTRILARTLLARYTGEQVDPSALKFERSSFGKPEIVWPSHTASGQLWHPPKISFNLSHTQSLIACVITGGLQVGIDVEEKERETHTNLVTFARRKFSKMEALRLEQLDNLEMRKNHFLQLWTLKESYGKALGKGIAGTTLRDIAFHFEELSATPDFLEKVTGIQAHEQVFSIRLEILNSLQADSKSWQFVLLQPTDAHYASVCVQQSGSFEQDSKEMQPLHLQIMKTIPLVKDEPLFDALALGLST